MKIQEKIRNKINKILIITILVIILGITQKINGQYYYYDSGTSTYPYQQGCSETLDVRVNTQNIGVSAGRFHLILDPSKISYATASNYNTLRSDLFIASTQTFSNRLSNLSPSRKSGSNNTILQTDRSNAITNYNGDDGLYGTIKFVPLRNASPFNGSFGMEFNPITNGCSSSATTETTLSVGGCDAININQQTSHLTGTYQFLQEPCSADTDVPYISFSNPIDQGNKQNKLNGISLSLSDANGENGLNNVPYIWTGGIWTGNQGGIISNQYGIDLNSFDLTIDGNGQTQTFTGSSLGVTVLGKNKTRQNNIRDYDITIDQSQIFDYGIEKIITITANVADREGNNADTKTIMFNYPVGPRLLGTRNPNNGAIFVNLSAPIKFGIQDNRAGVNSGSIKVTLQGTNGTSYGPYIFSGSNLNLSGIVSSANQPSYNINITNHPDFPASGTIRVIIEAEDMMGNTDTIPNYIFYTRPLCSQLQCCDISIITKNDEIIYNKDMIYISGRNSPTFYTGTIGSRYINCNSQNIGLKIYNGEGANSGTASILSPYYDNINLILSGRNSVKATLSGNTIYLSIIGLFGYNVTGAILFSGRELETGTLVGPEDLDLSTDNSFNSGIVIQSTGNKLSSGVVEAYLPPDTIIIQTGSTCTPIIIQHPALTGIIYAKSQLQKYNIYTTFKIGFACLGSQAKFYDTSLQAKKIEIRIKDPNLIKTGTTKVRYSNDLINRNYMGIANVSNHVASFKTRHFTYFALGNRKATRERPPITGLIIKLVKDNCPDGDYSDSYYDKDCGEAEIDEPPQETENYCPVGETQYSYEEVEAFKYAYGLGITTMCPIENARPYGYILRKELAKMISEFAIKVVGLYPNFSKSECNLYRDISKESQELQFYMKTACQLGLMGLYTDGITVNPDFYPNGYVDRAQFGTIMSRLIFGGKYNGNINNRYIDHLNALKQNQIMKYIENPTMRELRGYVMIMMKRADESGIIKQMRSVKDFINLANNLW